MTFASPKSTTDSPAYCELEHGTRDLQTNVTGDDVTVTAKIARAHLNEFPDYYSRLALMEAEAEAYWASQGE